MTAARKAVDRSSISRSRTANSGVFSTAAVNQRAPTTGQAIFTAATARAALAGNRLRARVMTPS